MNVLGLLEQVKLGTTFYPYGTVWRYITGTYTNIDVNNRDVYGSFSTGPITVTSLQAAGILNSMTTVFQFPIITTFSPTNSYVTEIGLFNATNLLAVHSFVSPIHVISNVPTVLPFSFNDTRTGGTQNYNIQAVITDNVTATIAESNNVQINYGGNFTLGHMDLNQTNPDIIPIRFQRSDINSTTTILGVIYKNTFNLDCNFLFQFAQTNKTYGNLTSTPFSATEKLSNFVFKNVTNDIINVKCFDIPTNTTGRYVLTETNFPLIQQIKNFRNGTYGTQGMFGALDLITLLVIIIAMIGLNRVNDAAGVIFAIMVLGSFAYFGIIEWPTIFLGALAIVTLVAISSTRKIIGG